MIKETLDHWGLPESGMSALTTDNAAYNDVACANGKWLTLHSSVTKCVNLYTACHPYYIILAEYQ